MIEVIRWPPREDLYFLGRNGIGKCAGVEVYHLSEDVVHLQPITSKQFIGRCEITVPLAALPRLVEVLATIARPNLVSRRTRQPRRSPAASSFVVPEPIDWRALYSQKRWLLRHAERSEKAAGLVELLDAIQDAAVACGRVPEELVFPDIPNRK